MFYTFSSLGVHLQSSLCPTDLKNPKTNQTGKKIQNQINPVSSLWGYFVRGITGLVCSFHSAHSNWL